MKWFGRSWGAAVCVPEASIATPVGTACVGCGNIVTEDTRGIAEVADDGTVQPFHVRCFARYCAPSETHRNAMEMGYGVLDVARKLMGPAPHKMADPLEHARDAFTRAMRGIELKRAAPPPSLIALKPPPPISERPFSAEKAREVANECVVAGAEKGAVQIHADKILERVAEVCEKAMA